MPKPTAHIIINWLHIAMKIQPMQQIVDHLTRTSSDRAENCLNWQGHQGREVASLARPRR
jgi:hypothetical protein